MSLKVLIVDDHSTVRMGIRMILEADPELEVVGEAADGRQAVSMTRALHPEVVLMDLRMPVLDGVAATGQITDAQLSRVLVLTTFDDDDYLFGALQAGAHGFLLKSSTPTQILAGVKTAASGNSVLDPAVTARVVAQAMSALTDAAAPLTALPQTLTGRETQVLQGLGQGLSNPQIAHTLGIGETTVKTHVSRVMSKLGVSSRLQAAKIAFTHWG